MNLNFHELSDFEPEQVANQVGPLKELLDLRRKLADLRGTLQGNEKLDEILQDVVGNTEKRQKLSAELGLEKGTNGGSND